MGSYLSCFVIDCMYHLHLYDIANTLTNTCHFREKYLDISFAQEAIDEFKVIFTLYSEFVLFPLFC